MADAAFKTPFILSELGCWHDPVPDPLRVERDDWLTDIQSEQLGRPVWRWWVESLRSRQHYEVEVFVGIRGEPCASCTCRARYVCKHIAACLVDLLDSHPLFCRDTWETPYMLGLIIHYHTLRLGGATTHDDQTTIHGGS